jgi:hypothetical protein
VERSKTEWNGINIPFHCLDNLWWSDKKFTFHLLPPKLDGTKLMVKVVVDGIHSIILTYFISSHFISSHSVNPDIAYVNSNLPSEIRRTWKFDIQVNIHTLKIGNYASSLFLQGDINGKYESISFDLSKHIGVPIVYCIIFCLIFDIIYV